jgi:D-sedoheptulose 7-phosphate isomerase
MQNKIQEIIRASIATKEGILANQEMLATVEKVVTLVTEAYRQGKRLYFCGNGGSAADAQHLAAEFTGRFYKNRKALPAEALHANTSYLTAVANDYSFDLVYARMVEGTMTAGDILFGFSTSGNSANILLAFEAARNIGVTTIGFTGSHGGKLKPLCDYLFNVPSDDTPRIQESHILLGHIICQLVEAQYFA